MADSGFEWTIYEIFEISIAVALFLIIGTAIIFAPQIELMQATATATELSYVSNLITNTPVIIKTKYPNFKIETNNNEILVKSNLDENIWSKHNIYGETLKLEKIDGTNYCLSSNQDCKTSNLLKEIKIDKTAQKSQENLNN